LQRAIKLARKKSGVEPPQSKTGAMHMPDWSELSATTLPPATPAAVEAAFAGWTGKTGSSKAACLSSIVTDTVTAFRSAIALNQANTLDSNPNAVPTAALHHAQNMIALKLALAMGTEIPAASMMLHERAEIWLGWVQRGLIKFPRESGSPTFSKGKGS